MEKEGSVCDANADAKVQWVVEEHFGAESSLEGYAANGYVAGARIP